LLFSGAFAWGGGPVFAPCSFLLLVCPPFSVQPRSLALKTRPSLILKPVPIGWNQEHYDVLEDGVVVGRIFLMPIGPRGRPWMWASGHNRAIARSARRRTDEAAMAAFARSWRRQ